ncbi:acetyl-CoA carboxylase biotin carboxyl carrier protein [Dictyobacter formicarum]|uniref:Acetyl-CoA carboxylase biotin carboxyl carrier protein subunit n=1 Tax=Dictyobacter formicarum TaxID=2778368 RepID=A0ABQ3VTE1_9CHLR|nr:biotin/lipoyl-containing protein [Dictyobacter formicarum]GHO89549.1 acetyl-CoA carboxylase biotin carboxyl carrier protein subunit [Dictyobacter formicarum]
MKNINTSTTVITPLTDEDLRTDIDEGVTLEQLRQLVSLIDSSDIAELEVRHGKTKTRIVLRKAAPAVVEYATPLASSASTEPVVESVTEQQPHVVTSPFVGFFQSWSKSKDQPLVKVGDAVKEGQHVAVIISIGVPNEVEAAVAGHVVELLVQDGEPVQYGQPLMTIMP